tara:strand:- start:222 stop:677 length:456 start_codon:yes stop_codon:yes gene_type:complete
MLKNAIYSVISPEGCATILWRDPKKTLEAAKAMKLSSEDLLELNIIDEIILEPSGGAHRDRELTLNNIKIAIEKNLQQLSLMGRDEIINHRKNKFLSIGRTKGFKGETEIQENLVMKEDFFQKNIFYIKKYKFYISLILLFFLLIMGYFYL